MYTNLAFAITLLGIFSIFEILKGNQKFSLLKYYLLAILITTTIVSLFDFLDLTGYTIPYYKSIFRVIGVLLNINLFFLIAIKNIPKQIIVFELFFILYFIIELMSGFQFPLLNDGKLLYPPTYIHQIFYVFYFLFIISCLSYNMYKLFSKNTNNLYEVKIKKWGGSLFIFLILLITIQFVFALLFSLGLNTIVNDSYITVFTIRLFLISFILFRPKFLDDDKYAIPFNEILVKTKNISFKDFEFLFYSNHYYLLADANIDDLALKLNATKSELVNFFKNEIDENFTELLNKNRIEYLKDLLKARKYESFTIEALSEMSGFNNRRTMYNAFNKYTGLTPTEYIQSLKY